MCIRDSVKGAYGSWETALRDRVRANPDRIYEMRVEASYNPGNSGVRPDAFRVSWRENVDGQWSGWVPEIFANQPGG